MAESKKGNGKGSSREIAERAVEQMQNLINRPIEAVTGLEKDGNEWTVTLEVLELERVPSTTDVLGKYEVTLDKDGELTGLQRTRRYARAEAGEV
jgi:gas vesicle protein GvpO